MSKILVRKFCQPVLDAAGYPMFHATLDDCNYSPGMGIYTSCSKTMAKVHGVSFSRSKPSIAECEYSADLLEDWLLRHKKDFATYIDAYSDWHALELPVYVSKDKKIRMGIDDNTHISVIKKYPIPKGKLFAYDTYPFKFILDGNDLDKVRYADWVKGIPLLPREISSRVQLTANLRKIAEDLLKQFAEYKKAEKAFEDAKARIEVCKV